MRTVNQAIRQVTDVHPWIGRVLTRLPIEYGAILPNGQPNNTMATNGKAIFVNPAFVDSLPANHVKGILVHEAVHVIQRHPLRRGNRDGNIYGIAIDAATNAIVLQLGYSLPNDRIDAVYDRTVEQIYADLVQEQDENDSSESDDSSSESDPDQNQQGAGAGTGDSEPQESDDSDENSESDDSEGDDDSDDMPSNTGTDDCMDYPLQPGETMQDAERAIDQLVAQAKMDMKFAGKEPSAGEAHVFEYTKSDLNWPRELEEYVNINGAADYSINPPHIGLMQNGIICNQLNPVGCGNVVLAVDTSGSIDRNKLNLALSHLMLFIENMDYETVRVIACSSYVGFDRTFYRGETVDLTEMRTGGGTRFAPVFDLVAKGEDPDLLIYFSDMEVWDMDNDFDAGYPVVWLVDNEYAINDKTGEWSGRSDFRPEVGKRIDTNV
jgi:predicted metal-dependent peptidase